MARLEAHYYFNNTYHDALKLEAEVGPPSQTLPPCLKQLRWCWEVGGRAVTRTKFALLSCCCRGPRRPL